MGEAYMIRLCLSIFLAASSTSGVSFAAPDSFPSKPIKIVIPFAVGGTADPLARMLADVIQKRTGAVFVIESRPGAGANIGAAEVARSESDGHTILLGANNNFVVNQFMFPKSAVNPERDFSLISILVDQPQVVYVSASFEPKTLSDLVAYVKARPGQINFASPSAGSAPHLAGELLSDQFGLQMVHVPYRGGAPAVTALLAGEVQIYLASLSVGKALIDSGKLRALAVTASTRMKSLPDVPTTREAGAPELTLSNWWALAAPAGVPMDRIAWIRREFTQALQNPAAKAQLEELGFVMYGSTLDEFETRVRKESAIYQRLIQQRKLAIE
jgi:tripartite-type tricarboxylate transporter receptor subunit TctC